MGNSGTAARLLAGILASHPFFSVMTGDASLRGRPMRRVTDPLAACGARFSARAGGRLPLAIEGARDPLPLEYRVPVPSAQVKSALLLCGLNAPGLTRIEEPEATRDHSENMLRHFGAEVTVEAEGAARIITLAGQPHLRAADVVVPGDPSSAAFPDRRGAAGAGVARAHRGGRAQSAALRPVRHAARDGRRSDASRTSASRAASRSAIWSSPIRRCARWTCRWERAPSMIDEYPVLAVAAAFAEGTTRMRGLKELRVKESDRLTATAALLAANGVRVEIEGDDLIVHGSRPPRWRGGGGDAYGPPPGDERPGARAGHAGSRWRWTMPRSSTPVFRVSSR